MQAANLPPGEDTGRFGKTEDDHSSLAATKHWRPDRKDMVGIAAHVDIDATTANFTHKMREGGIDYKAKNGCLFTLKSIIAGSIRAPDRLHAAGLVETDECTCVDCRGERADAHHIIWCCPRHNHIRKPYADQLNELAAQVLAFSPPRAAQLHAEMQRPSFQLWHHE